MAPEDFLCRSIRSNDVTDPCRSGGLLTFQNAGRWSGANSKITDVVPRTGMAGSYSRSLSN